MTVRSRTMGTDRLRTHYIESGPDDGVPVVLLHGNLSTARYEHDDYRPLVNAAAA